MDCPKCHKKKIAGKKHSCNVPRVIQIESPSEVITYHTIQLQSEQDFPVTNGAYRNTIVEYLSDATVYLYNSDGIPVKLTPDALRDFNQLANRPKYDGVEMTSATNIPDLSGDIQSVANDLAAEIETREQADALFDNAINRTVLTDLAVDPNPSTTVIQLESTKTNLKTGISTSEDLPFPVASDLQAGVMNSALYNAVSQNTSNISALMNGAVAIAGLPASPSQAELTSAWESETGLSALMNRAGIYDIDNDKVWTYYSNTDTWYPASNTAQVVINTFTNSSEGVIKGSTNIGQVFAENDGTGSVNGWDSLNARVSNLESGGWPVVSDYQPLGYSMEAAIYRYGNIVIVLSPTTVCTPISSSISGDPIVLLETIPQGFRPIHPATINGIYQDAEISSTTFHSGISWNVGLDGSLGIRFKTAIPTAHRVRVSVQGVWLTNDAWPGSNESA